MLEGSHSELERDFSPQAYRLIPATLRAPQRKSHIFDGKELHRSEATYQLVDITDSLLYDLIRDPNARSSTVDVSRNAEARFIAF